MNIKKELGEQLDEMVKGLDLVQKDTQSVNAKVEALGKDKEKRPKVAFIHNCEGSFEEGNYSERSRSSLSSRGERCERIERHERVDRQDRHGTRREEPRMEELDLSKVVDISVRRYKEG
ncbi:hypothetical protein CR513_17287, partial [Mucuna pruriens]